ncbi:ATP-dependent DNA helicase PIF1-like protein [Tanacetum coccineum]
MDDSGSSRNELFNKCGHGSTSLLWIIDKVDECYFSLNMSSKYISDPGSAGISTYVNNPTYVDISAWTSLFWNCISISYLDTKDDVEVSRVYALAAFVIGVFGHVHHLGYLLALGEEMVHLSCDNLHKTERGVAIDQSFFSPKFTKGLKFSDVPNHILALRVRVPVMLLRNIDQPNGLCNGTRLQVLKLTRTSINA